MKNNDFYHLPKAGKFTRFLWDCAGGDRFLLERATYSDQVKYMCLGGIVLATGVMASLAGGYAFYTIFAPKSAEVLDKMKTAGNTLEVPTDPLTVLLSVIFGIIWGLIIFNIDRFIVTSTGKGDGTEKITRSELVGALPRIFMGAIIAITISKPVEIRMFKSEIDVELQNAQMEKEKEFRDKVDAEFNIEIGNVQKEINKYDSGIQDKINRHKELEKQYIEEARIVTVGPRAIAIKAQMDAVAKEIENAQSAPEYQNLLAEKTKLEEERKTKLKNSYKVASGLDGLVERIKLSHKVAGNTITFFITLLFLAIELTPVFFKLMLIKSPYDYIKDNNDDLIKTHHGIEVRYDYYKDKEGLERHLVIHHDAQNQMFEKLKISRIQKELTEYALELYKQREKEKINENLDDYIQKMS
jgi:hypothetical protein